MPGALRIALTSYIANGLVAALGLLVISAFVYLLLGPGAAAAAAVGVIVATPPDQPAPRRGKFMHFLPALLAGTPLFFATSLVRASPVALMVLLVSATFVAFLAAAWGKRGLPVAVSVMFAMLFALAVPPAAGPEQAWQATIAFGLGAWLYALWGTLANALLNARYRVLALADALAAVAALMRSQGLRFTLGAEAQRRTALDGRLIRQQAALAEQLQAARDLLLEAPATPRRRQLAGMLMQLLDLRDHLLACALDLDALRAVPEQQELLQVLGVEIQALAGDIEQLSDALLLRRPPAPAAQRRPALAALAAMAAAPSGTDVHAPPSQMLAGALARRVGYLHEEVARIVELARGEREPDMAVVRSAWQLFVSPTPWTWRPFLALWRRDAPPLRHAIRASLAIAAGYAAGLALPWGSHEYWILLTITVVLRGSLAQTIERRNGRVAGTLLGCLLGGLLLLAQAPLPVLVLAVAVAQGVAHGFALQRYLVAAVAATVLALGMAHLLQAGGTAPAFEVAERLVDTLIGVAIAWVFSYVLPSWERTQVGALLRRALAAQAKHAGLALEPGQRAKAGRASELAWRLARREAYDSLSALVQAVQRSLAEPRAVRPPLAEIERMLGHSYQLLAQLAAVRTMLLQRRQRLDLELLREPLDAAARAIAGTLASGAANPLPLPAPEAPPMPESLRDTERDLTPLLLRRLGLATGTAGDLQAAAAQALAAGR